MFASVILGTSCSRHDDSSPAEANGKGKVTIVYQEDGILPENRDTIKKIKDAGVFERMADRLTKVVALPHDLQIIVTDKLPKAIDCPTTELDGRTILWPAAFSKATHDVLTESLPEVIATSNQSLGFFFGIVWNDGIDSSIATHGNLSSRKIAFCGLKGIGSSSDAIVKSIVSDSLLSSKNKCVPQHAANERIRFAYGILRGSLFVRTRSPRGTDPHCTYGAPVLRRQSMQ